MGISQITGESGIYYSQEGYFETIVDGEHLTGTWSTNNDGTLCRHIKSLPDSCEVYYHNGGVVSTVTDDVVATAPKLVSGNTVIEKVMFTPQQTTALVSGKTVIWDPNGGAYYFSDGRLDTLWDGVHESGTWQVNDEGAICWDVPSWGPTPCELYYHGDDGLRVIYQGQDSPASEHREGNVLDSL